MDVVRRVEGRSLRVLGDHVVIKLRSGTSPYRLAVVTVEVPPGSGTPCVSHTVEEEVYFVLEGELQMYAAAERHTLHPGDLVHLLPGTPHGYRNASEHSARFLAWTVGGPMDEFFEQVAERVHAMPRDISVLQDVMKEFGVVRAT